MFQDEDKGMKSPDIYIRTGESTALAVIKLVEILVACGAMILLLLNGYPVLRCRGDRDLDVHPSAALIRSDGQAAGREKAFFRLAAVCDL